MRAWNGRAFAAAIVGGICLASVVHYAGETNDPRFVPSARAQPEPIRRLIDWLRGLTMPAGIVKAEGRIEATQVDVSSKYAGEVVDVAVQEGDKVAAGHVIARLSSPQLEAQLRNAESELKSAKEVRAQDAIKAAEAKVEQIKSMISELMLVSSREGKVQYQLAHAGDSVAAGAPIVTLIDLNDVYMTVFLRAADAGKLATGEGSPPHPGRGPGLCRSRSGELCRIRLASRGQGRRDQGQSRQADAPGRSEDRSEGRGDLLRES
jgi:multidrug efflux pump subunit AcrA (membrane-fusion protein)